MSGRREVVATCTGERADSRTGTAREQTGTVSGERMPPDFPWNSGIPVCSLDPDCDRKLRERAGRLAAGGVRNTKDRDAPALEVRAGSPV